VAADLIVQALGLNTSPNALEVPPGSLLEASNIIIQRNNVVESRRGFKLYGTAMPNEEDRAKQLLVYKGRILRHIGNFLRFDSQVLNADNESIFESFNRQFTRLGNTTEDSDIIENINTQDLVIGLSVTGSGIPASTTVIAVNPTSITLSDDASATASEVTLTFTGNELVTEVTSGQRIRSVQSNGNAYITSSQGIRKLSATSAAGLTSENNFMTLAGGLKAIDIRASLQVSPGEVTGFLPQDSAVAYRAVWGIEDANKNLILGAPSERSVVYNTLLSLIIEDFMRILLAVDNCAANAGGAAIDTYGYLQADKVAITDSATTLRTNLLDFASRLDTDLFGAQVIDLTGITWTGGVATATFGTDHGLQVGDIVKFTNLAPAGFNGIFTVQTIPTSKKITYNLSIDPSAYFSGTDVRHIKYLAIDQPSEPSLPATNNQLVALQDYLGEILALLQAEPNANITTANLAAYITPLLLTTSATTQIRVEIPTDITSNHFLQLYRSSLAQAIAQTSLNTVNVSDELRQVYEAFPTAAELAQGYMIIDDTTPIDFSVTGPNLYTNPSTGEGILQANDVPPVAVDIARFQNTVFYANTRTKERLFLNMLGVTNLLAGGIVSTSLANPTTITTDANHGLTTGDLVYINNTGSTPALSGIYKATVTGNTTFTVPVNVTSGGTGGYWTNSMLSIISATSSNVYKFIKGSTQTTTVATISNSSGGNNDFLNGKYFLLNAGGDTTQYYVWYKSSGTAASDPTVANKTGIRVDIVASDSANQVAIRTRDAIAAIVTDFTTSVSTNTVTILTTAQGNTTNASAGTSGFTVNTTVLGRGENTANQEVLLSNAVSPAIALEDTTRSLVVNINSNNSEIINAYYTSTISSVPGKMLLEGKSLSTPKFYLLGSSDEIGISFDPDIAPSILSNFTASVANPTVITTAEPHGLSSGDQIVSNFSNSTPALSGLYTITYLSDTTFSVPIEVTVAGTTGLFEKITQATSSDNEVKVNRVYYSKVDQPEAVPLLNYFDIGAGDQEILRIFPLRTSLFVFKEDGLYRISGDSAPFIQELFDESIILKAPDSLDLGNNQLYGWTIQGIQVISEAGADPIPLSRPIDVDIIKLASANFPNFSSLTWGIGYNSDNSYTVYTNTAAEDTAATIGYRYSFLTKSWTTIDKTVTCGIINPADDKMYLGAGDTNYTEQERKTFTRLDYADREIVDELVAARYFQATKQLKLDNVTQFKAGDVLTQTQLVPAFIFNALLSKLDADPGLAHIDITNITTGSTITITTDVGPKGGGHNCRPDDYVTLTNTNCIPSIDGTYLVLSTPTPTTLTITPTTPVLTAGDSGSARLNYRQSLALLPGGNVRDSIVTLASILFSDPNTQLTNYNEIVDSIGSYSLTKISAETPTVITTVEPNNPIVSNRIVVFGSTDSVPVLTGPYVATRIDDDQFSVPVQVVVEGTTGFVVGDADDPRDQQACFNILINNLNNDPGVGFSNYTTYTSQITLETIITDVNIFTTRLTLADDLPFLQGDITIYEAILTRYAYAPLTMNDPLGLKHMRETTMMFANKAFTTAMLSFASDLQPQFIPQTFTGMGVGTFGSGIFGANYFGGGANSAPFRTIIPRNCQRCRYLLIRFEHRIAREQYAIFGITLTGEASQSSRAYR